MEPGEFLGQGNDSVRDDNGGLMLLYVCPNPQNGQ